MEWKTTFEKETRSQYVKQHGSKRSENIERTTYYCNRSGFYVEKGKNKRHLKSQGSKKINAHCPSCIKVVKSGDGDNEVYEVLCVSTHVGHQQELGHISLSKNDREWIASLMLKGVDHDHILNKIRDNLSGELERIHLLTKQDMLNIESSYCLNATVRSSNDLISVESWIKEMEARSEPLILLCKPQGVINNDFIQLGKDDFFLATMNKSQMQLLLDYGGKAITMDTTHGLNSYGFDLTTLLILDDLHSGFPVSFLFSNHADERTLEVWLTLIKERTGAISSNCIMTDDAEAYYNAWKRVMGDVPHRLLCSWHVDQSWRRNLSKIQNEEKRLAVYNILRTLLQEIDKEAFIKMLDNAVALFNSDKEIAEFGKYFVAHYAGRTSTWAFCYRIGVGLNTNMHLESMHKVIKYIYLKGKKVKRLDKTIRALMSFLRDKLYDRIISCCKGKVTRKIRDIRNSHLKSLELTDVFVNQEGENSWLVKSDAVFGEFYTVKHQSSVQCSCRLCCPRCGQVCIHQYSCTCIDYAVQWNMCKHIHLVCRLKFSAGTSFNEAGYSRKENNSEDCTSADAYETSQCDLIVDENCCPEQHQLEITTHVEQLQKDNLPDNIQNLKQEIMSHFESVSLKISQINSTEMLKEIKKMIKPLSSTVDVMVKNRNILVDMSNNQTTSSFGTHSNEPANKNIEQQRFYTVKKGRQPKQSVLRKPTSAECQDIAVQLTLVQRSSEA